MKRSLIPFAVCAVLPTGCSFNISMGSDSPSPSASVSSSGSFASPQSSDTPSPDATDFQPSDTPSADPLTLNTTDVETEISKGLEDQIGSGTYDVTCPADILAEEGNVFTCDVTSNDGSTATVTVTQEDSVGGFHWKVTDASSAVDPDIAEEMNSIYEEVWAEYTVSDQEDFCSYYKTDPQDIVDGFVDGFFEDATDEELATMPTQDEVRQTWAAFLEDKCGYTNLDDSGDVSGGTSV